MYVCKVLDAQTCIEWVAYETSNPFDALAISKEDMVLIGGSISGVLALILAFVIVAKALKTM